MKTFTSTFNQTQNPRTMCKTTQQTSSGDFARSTCDEINTKTNHIMRTLYLQQTENRLSEQMFGPSLCENTANVATVQTNKNSLRTGAARLLMSFYFIALYAGNGLWANCNALFTKYSNPNRNRYLCQGFSCNTRFTRYCYYQNSLIATATY